MTSKTYRLNITTTEGQPLFTVLITRERSEVEHPVLPSAPPARIPAPTLAPALSGNGEPRMTEPQRRYLFRLLAQQGLDGKATEAHLKQAFQVTTLREVSKASASHLIEQMVADQKEAGHAHA